MSSSRNRAYRILFVFALSVLMLSPGIFMGQSAKRSSRNKLSKERKRIEEQIRLSSQLLKETNYQRDKSLVELSLLNKQIALREELISSLNREIRQLSDEIKEINQVSCSMEEDLEDVKAEYARTTQLTYKTLSDDNLLLVLLSAESLAEAYYRTLYYQQFTRFRRTQLERLKKSTEFLNHKSQELRETISSREKLVDEKKVELDNLKATKAEQNSLFFTLKDKEIEYRRRLDKQRNSLKKLIRKVDTSYGSKSVAKAQINSPTSKSFAKNKGSLPWPITSGQGLVIGKFGLTKDPFGNRIKNDGVYIRTTKGEKVRAVFSGKVTGVQKVPLSGTMVIIEHGIYRTVYANLAYVKVKVGDQVKTGHQIGTVRTDGRTNETVLNFLVYRIPDVFENPMKWIVN